MLFWFQEILWPTSSSINSLNLFLDSIIAFAAIGASIFAGLTWRQAQRSHNEERESRRSFIAPKDEPGFFRLNYVNEDNIRFSNCLMNYGINPTSKLQCKFIFFNHSYKPLFDYPAHASNPIPHNGEFRIEVSDDHFLKYEVEKSRISMVKFISLEISYYDVFLNKFYSDIFCWHVMDDRLNETNLEERNTLIELTKEINSKGTETKDLAD